MAALGVECVGGDHRVGQVDPGGGELVEQRGEHGDLVGLRTDLDLAEDQGVVVGGGGEQMDLVALGVGRAAHRLAVDRDREQWPVGRVGRVGVGRGGRCRRGDAARPAGRRRRRPWRGGLVGQPGADRRVHRGGVGAGDHPPDRRLRRRTGASAVELHQQLGGHVGDPAGDRAERAHARHDRRRAQREHHRDRVNPALVHSGRRTPRRTVAAGQGHSPPEPGSHRRRSDPTPPHPAQRSRTRRWQDAAATELRWREVCERTPPATGAPSPLPPRHAEDHQVVSRRSTPGRSNTKINDLEMTVGFGVRGPTRSGVSSQHTA